MFRNLSFRKFRFPQDKWCIICSLFSTGLWLEMQARHTQDPLCHPTFHFILDVYSSHSLFCLWLPRPKMWSVWDDQAGQWDSEAGKYWSGLTGWAVHLLPPGNVSDINDEHGNNRERKAYISIHVHTFLTPYISDSQRPSRFKSAHYICWSGTSLCQGCVSASKINFAQSQCCYKNAHSWAHVWPPGLTAWRCSIWRTYILHLVMDIDNIEDHHFSNLTPNLCVEQGVWPLICSHRTQNC